MVRVERRRRGREAARQGRLERGHAAQERVEQQLAVVGPGRVRLLLLLMMMMQRRSRRLLVLGLIRRVGVEIRVVRGRGRRLRLGLKVLLRGRRGGAGVEEQVGGDGVEEVVGPGGRLGQRRRVVAAWRRRRRAPASAAAAGGRRGRIVVVVVMRHFSRVEA